MSAGTYTDDPRPELPTTGETKCNRCGTTIRVGETSVWFESHGPFCGMCYAEVRPFFEGTP